jgi:hypothetical protein
VAEVVTPGAPVRSAVKLSGPPDEELELEVLEVATEEELVVDLVDDDDEELAVVEVVVTLVVTEVDVEVLVPR